MEFLKLGASEGSAHTSIAPCIRDDSAASAIHTIRELLQSTARTSLERATVVNSTSLASNNVCAAVIVVVVVIFQTKTPRPILVGGVLQ